MAMKRMVKILSIFIFSLLIIVGYTQAASAQRLSGGDRYQTANAIADAAYPGTVQAVILATGNNFPDALAGSVLANKLNAPILLVGSSVNESSEAFDYIKNHLTKNGTIYLLGTKSIINQGFSDTLTGQGFAVKQIGGSDRYETSELIAQAENVSPGTPVVITSGENFFDALSISSFAANKGWPILLTSGDGLSDAVKSFITNDKPTKVYAVSGSGGLSDKVQTEISSITSDADITWFTGSDRFETETNIAQVFAANPDHIYVATGQNFADALTGSVLAAQTGSPIILVDPGSSELPSSVVNYLQSAPVPQGNNVPDITPLGGTSAVPDSLVSGMQAVLSEIAPQNPDNSVQPISVTPVVTAVTGISLNQPTLNLTAGGNTYTLVATVTPADAANQAVTWNTSNDSVATVNNGVVTPVGAGTATITVTTQDGAETAASIVTVAPATAPAEPTTESGTIGSTGGQEDYKGQILDITTDQDCLLHVTVKNTGDVAWEPVMYGSGAPGIVLRFEVDGTNFGGMSVTKEVKPSETYTFINGLYNLGGTTEVHNLTFTLERDTYGSGQTLAVLDKVTKNSVSSQTASGSVASTSTSGGVAKVTTAPPSVNFAQGSSQVVTITAVDSDGNPIPNQTIYLQGGSVNGLWLSQIDGTAIQQTLNLGTSSTPSFYIVATPVPLFNYNNDDSIKDYQPVYNMVYVAGALAAGDLNDNKTPFVALTTGVNGTISVTVQNGNVAYYCKNGDAAAQVIVDSGAAISSAVLNFFSGAPGSAGAVNIGSISVNVQ